MLKTSIQALQGRADPARAVRAAAHARRRAGVAVALLVAGAAASAGVVTEANSQFLSGTYSSSWYNAVTDVGGAVASITDSRSFEATGRQGQAMTIDYAGQARAQASQTSLSAYARVDLQNPTPIGSNPIYANDDDSLNAGGVPAGYAARSVASMYDTISVGQSSVAFLRFRIALDGEHRATVDHPNNVALGLIDTLVQFDQRSPGWQNVFWDGNGAVYDRSTFSFSLQDRAVDATFFSAPIPVVNGQAAFSFWLWAHASIYMYEHYGIEGGSFMAEADFGHTLSLLELHAYDATGAEVQLTDAFGQSGTQYAVAEVALPPPAAVPEPGTTGLVLAALALAGLRRTPRPRGGGRLR